MTRNGSKDRRGTEVYPGCKGKVCLPDAQLCAERQQKVGEEGEVGAGGGYRDSAVSELRPKDV